MTDLGINIDHVATLRQQRKEGNPDIVESARWAIAGGADNITIHLREDRRHIQDDDVFRLRSVVPNLNFECSTAPDIINIAIQVRTEWTCLVPEKRQELTTEGGLNLSKNTKKIASAIQRLSDHHINASLFINPNPVDVRIAKDLGAQGVELHTGIYALADDTANSLADIKECAEFAASLGLKVQAGHGLNYDNIADVVAIPEIQEVNIGHSIVCRAIEVGLTQAVSEMKACLLRI